jgi:uncharacterized membrane protein
MQADQASIIRSAPVGRLRWRDFQLIAGGYFVLLTLISLSELHPLLGLVRLGLGLVYAFYVPGYCLGSALLARADDLAPVERAGLSIGLSIALLTMLALILDQLPWGLAPTPIVIALGLSSTLFAVIALTQRAIWPAPAAPALPPDRSRIMLVAGAALALAILVSAAVLTLIITVPAPSSALTEFYALGEAGLAEGYPRLVAPGEPMAVTLGVTNQEGRSMRYRVEARAAGELLATAGPFVLAPGASWQQPLSYALARPGADQTVELLLFVEGQAAPYRRLQLWVDVAAPG